MCVDVWAVWRGTEKSPEETLVYSRVACYLQALSKSQQVLTREALDQVLTPAAFTYGAFGLWVCI